MDNHQSPKPSPPVSGSASWGVFMLNDCEWWMARTLEEAVSAATRFYGEDADVDCPRKLSQAELEKYEYCDENHKVIHSFAVELENRIASNPEPQMFATTDF